MRSIADMTKFHQRLMMKPLSKKSRFDKYEMVYNKNNTNNIIKA
jgi:hypothetical protein